MTQFTSRFNTPKVMMYLFAVLLLSFHSLLFANVAMAKGSLSSGNKDMSFCHSVEQKEITIMLNIKQPGMIKGSLCVNINSMLSPSANNSGNPMETAENLIKDKLRFLTGNSHTDINVEFATLQNQANASGYEVINFSFAKHVRGVWEIAVPQDMKTLNIAVLAGMKRKMRSAPAGESLTLII